MAANFAASRRALVHHFSALPLGRGIDCPDRAARRAKPWRCAFSICCTTATTPQVNALCLVSAAACRSRRWCCGEPANGSWIGSAAVPRSAAVIFAAVHAGGLLAGHFAGTGHRQQTLQPGAGHRHARRGRGPVQQAAFAGGGPAGQSLRGGHDGARAKVFAGRPFPVVLADAANRPGQTQGNGLRPGRQHHRRRTALPAREPFFTGGQAGFAMGRAWHQCRPVHHAARGGGEFPWRLSASGIYRGGPGAGIFGQGQKTAQCLWPYRDGKWGIQPSRRNLRGFRGPHLCGGFLQSSHPGFFTRWQMAAHLWQGRQRAWAS